MNVVDDIYAILEDATGESEELRKKRDEIKERMNSPKYTQEYKDVTLQLKLQEIDSSLRAVAVRANTKALERLDKEKKEIQASYALKPDMIDKDDMELLKTDLLTERDLQEMAARHEGNITMLTLIERKARSAGLDAGVELAQELHDKLHVVDTMQLPVELYTRNHMKHGTAALKTLQRFFEPAMRG